MQQTHSLIFICYLRATSHPSYAARVYACIKISILASSEVLSESQIWTTRQLKRSALTTLPLASQGDLFAVSGDDCRFSKGERNCWRMVSLTTSDLVRSPVRPIFDLPWGPCQHHGYLHHDKPKRLFYASPARSFITAPLIAYAPTSNLSPLPNDSTAYRPL